MKYKVKDIFFKKRICDPVFFGRESEYFKGIESAPRFSPSFCFPSKIKTKEQSGKEQRQTSVKKSGLENEALPCAEVQNQS